MAQAARLAASRSLSSRFVTTTAVFHPMMGCLHELASALGVRSDAWVPNSDRDEDRLRQQRMLGLTSSAESDLEALTAKEFRSKGSRDVREINGLLRAEGFNIQLDPLPVPRALYACGILKVGVKWREPGIVTTLPGTEGQRYPAVRIDDAGIFTSTTHPHPIVKLDTAKGDCLFLTVAHEQLDNEVLLSYLAALTSGTLMSAPNRRGVYFPMVALDERVDISWLKGLTARANGEWVIAQALQQTKFSMDEVGAKVKSASVMAGLRAGMPAHPPQPVKIDQPFFVALVRTGMRLPYFTGLIAETHWRRPNAAQ